MKIGKGAFWAALLVLTSAPVIGNEPVRADVGARIYVQGWNPAQPDKHLFVSDGGVVEYGRPLTEDPKIVSQAVGKAWSTARATLCDQIIDTLRAANSGSQGVSFKQMNCDMARGGDVVLISNAPHRDFGLQFVVKGNYLHLHSTTPSLKNGHLEVWAGPTGVLGAKATALPGLAVTRIMSNFQGLFGGRGLRDWADPQFKIYYDLALNIRMGVAPSGALTVTQTQAVVGNLHAQPTNAAGRLAKAATDFAHVLFHTPAFDALLQKAIEDGGKPDCKSPLGSRSGTLARCFTKEINNALKEFNYLVNANNNATKRLVSLGAWAKNNMINIVFSPRSPVSLPLTGVIQGKIRFIKSRWYSAHTCPTDPGLVSEVTVGPRPIVGVDPMVYGDAPVRRFPGRIQYIGQPAIQNITTKSFDCPYALTQLPGGVPNFVMYGGNGTGGLTGVSGPNRSPQGTGAHTAKVFTIKAAGWDQHVVPNLVLTGKDWEASVGFSLTGSLAEVQPKPYVNTGAPRSKTNPAVQRNNPASGGGQRGANSQTR